MNVNNVKTSFGTDKIARICGVTRPTIGDWIKRGKLRSYKTVGGHNRVWINDLVEFLTGQGIAVPDYLKVVTHPLILLVEDSAATVRLMKSFIAGLDPEAQVQVVNNGFDAGAVVEQVRPDLIVLDVYLPGINGVQVCESIRKNINLKQVKILAVSGKDTLNTRKSMLAAGADAFLAKPFSSALFSEYLQRFLPKKIAYLQS